MTYELEYGEFKDRPLAFLRAHKPDMDDAQYLVGRWPKIFTNVPYVVSSRQYDYGGPNNEANYNVWREDFSETEGKTWWALGRDNGILLRLDIATSDQRDALERLERNGVLDEDAVSELEMELQTENWNDYGRSDLKRDIVAFAREDTEGAEDSAIEEMLDVVPDKIFDAAYWEAAQNTNGPYQDGGGYGTVFPEFVDVLDGWDGSQKQLVAWLGLKHWPTPEEFWDVVSKHRPDMLEKIKRHAAADRYDYERFKQEAKTMLDELWAWREIFEERAPKGNKTVDMILVLVKDAEGTLRALPPEESNLYEIEVAMKHVAHAIDVILGGHVDIPSMGAAEKRRMKPHEARASSARRSMRRYR